MFKDSLDLHKFAKAALPYKAMEIADPAILLHEETQGRDASNAALVRSRTEGCLVSVIGLGVSCSKKWPRERMVVQDAAVQMHAKTTYRRYKNITPSEQARLQECPMDRGVVRDTIES